MPMNEQQTSLSKVIRNLIWPRRKRLFLGLLLVTISKLAALVVPGAFKYLIDEVLIQNQIDLLKIIIACIIIAIIIQSISSFLLAKILSIAAHRVIAELRLKIQEKIIHQPLSFFDKNKSGAIAKRIMDDIDGVKNLIGTGFVLLIGGIITSLGSLILLIYINATLTAYIVFPLILMGITTLKAFKYLRPIFRKRKAVEAAVQGRLIESLGGIRVIKGFHAEEFEKNVFKKGVHTIFKYYKKTLTVQALILSLATLIMGFATAAIIWFGSNLILKGNLEIGEFVSFIFYLGFMISPIIQISNIGSLLTEALAGLDRTEKIINLKDEKDDPNRTFYLEEFQKNIIFKNVSFSYVQGTRVINNFNATFSKGSTTALVGLSGAGKSTIASLVASFINPTEGTIYVDGIDLSKIHIGSYRSHLGMVLQEDFLFDGSIKENILFSQKNTSENDLAKVVEASYVNEFIDRFEKGLDTIIGERGVKLSGGQKQRISIARALLSNPSILILDEATSSLDTESEFLIQKSLVNLTKGRTTFVIAHRLSTIRNADQILFINKGELTEKGTHDLLMKQQGKYYELVTLQSKI